MFKLTRYRSSQLKYRETTYSRLYFHECGFSHEICENIVPQKFRTLWYVTNICCAMGGTSHEKWPERWPRFYSFNIGEAGSSNSNILFISQYLNQ